MLNADDSITTVGATLFVGQVVSGTFIPICGDTSAAGTVKITGSNEAPVGDPNAYVPPDASFAAIIGATSAVASGVGPAIVIATLNYQYIRATYTSSSGGTTTIQVQASLLGV